MKGSSGKVRRRSSRGRGRRKLSMAVRAYRAGRRCGAKFLKERLGHETPKAVMNRYWNEWKGRRTRTLSRDSSRQLARRFFRGFCKESGERYRPWLPFPGRGKVGIVLCIRNEKKTVERVLNELDRLPFHEIIAVVNGSTDGSFEKIRKHRAGVTILHYEEPLGHDVGRAIGARVSTSDILLFADGDLPIRAEKLLHFVEEIEKGADVALNDITPYLRPFSRRDAVSTVKEFVNRALGRPDLMANSLTAVPHALSRKALERIGAAALAVPPLAQVIAIQSGLRIKAPASVNIIRGNRRRASNSGHLNPVSRLIAGDHLEALHRALHKSGSRLHYKDHMRRREYAEVGR